MSLARIREDEQGKIDLAILETVVRAYVCMCVCTPVSGANICSLIDSEVRLGKMGLLWNSLQVWFIWRNTDTAFANGDTRKSAVRERGIREANHVIVRVLVLVFTTQPFNHNHQQ